MLNLKGISYGDVDIFKSEIKYATLDTFLDFIYLGYSDYILFIDQLKKASDDFECETYYHCYSNAHTCDHYTTSLSDLVF